MAEHEGDTYRNATIEIDGHGYTKCAFENCILVYSGGEPPNFSGCTLDKIQVVFKGPAKNTVALLQSMSRPSSGFQQLIARTFSSLGKH